MSRVEQLNKEKVLLKNFGLYILVALGDVQSTLRFDPQCLSYFKETARRNTSENEFCLLFLCTMSCTCLRGLWGIANGIGIFLKFSSIASFSQQQMVSYRDYTREIQQDETAKKSLPTRNCKKTQS